MTESKKNLIKPAIIVDKTRQEGIRKDLINPIEIVDKKSKFDPEVQIYIVLYVGNDDNSDIKSFDVIKGRVSVYEHIKNLVDYIDCVQSKVIANGVDFDEAFSVYYFMKVMKQYFDDGFDIEDYVDGNSGDDENIGLSIDL